jgi:putative MATE family efflux protein
MDNNKADFIEGPVGKKIILKTLPMIIGMVGMLSFNLIDTYFVGQISTEALAAISYTFPITYIVVALSMGIGTGASALVSNEIGRGDKSKTVRYASDALTLGLVFVLIFMVVGVLTIRPLFSLLGAEGKVLDEVYNYMSIWYLGNVFVMIPMIGNSLLRAKGDMKTPSFIMMVAVVVNTILDPLLIFGMGPFPELGIRGAAIATVIARAITLFVSLHYLYRRDKLISFKVPRLADVKESYKRILHIALPSAGTSMIMPVSISVLLGIISVYGPEAVAGFGVASRIEALSLTVIMALGSVLGPFIGQNLGANKIDRVIKGFKFSSAFAMLWGLLMLIVLAFLAVPIGSLFNDNPTVISVIQNYLWIVPVSYGFQSVIMLTGVTFNVMQKPYKAALIAILRMVVLYIPLAYLASLYYGLNGIFVAATISNFLIGIIGYFWIIKYTGKLENV